MDQESVKLLSYLVVIIGAIVIISVLLGALKILIMLLPWIVAGAIVIYALKKFNVIN